MSEQITWTHVDKLVRDMHDEKGMLPIGLTDAEVCHAFIKWQERNRDILLAKIEERDREIVRLYNDIDALKNRPVVKTKQRLSALEAAVEELQDRLERHCV